MSARAFHEKKIRKCRNSWAQIPAHVLLQSRIYRVQNVCKSMHKLELWASSQLPSRQTGIVIRSGIRVLAAAAYASHRSFVQLHSFNVPYVLCISMIFESTMTLRTSREDRNWSNWHPGWIDAEGRQGGHRVLYDQITFQPQTWSLKIINEYKKYGSHESVGPI